MEQVHEVKLDIAYVDAVRCGDKPFEIRYNDRGYQKGDKLVLRPWCSINHCYDTDSLKIRADITYVTTYGQKDGWCVLGIRVTNNKGKTK